MHRLQGFGAGFGILIVAALAPMPAAACPVDTARTAAYFAAKITESDKFFAIDGPIMRLAYLGPAAKDAVPALKGLARKGRGAVRYLALWAVARIAPGDGLVQSSLAEAARKLHSRSFYERLTAAALIAVGEAGSLLDRSGMFVPSILADYRKLAAKPKRQVFRRAMIAWALYEVGTPEAVSVADEITQGFIDRPFESTPLTGLDAFEVIGPHARAAVPLLIRIAERRHDISTRVYDDDAARALMAVGGEAARRAFAGYMERTRQALSAKPTARRLGDLVELLPYSYCARADVEAVLEADGHDDLVYVKAVAFLIGVGSDLKDLMEKRLTFILLKSANRRAVKKARSLKKRLKTMD